MNERPLACDMSALTPQERRRYAELIRKLQAARVATGELPDGYELILDPRAIAPAELTEWMELESRCCPFLDFGVALRLTGGEGVKEFLRHEFSLG